MRQDQVKNQGGPKASRGEPAPTPQERKGQAATGAGQVVPVNQPGRQQAELVGKPETESLSQPRPREGLGKRPVATPLIDAFENDDAWMLRADVPGARPENTQVWYDPREGLTVHVKPALPLEDVRSSQSRELIREFAPVDWYFSVQLPEWLDGHAARSSVRNGVLTVEVPKREQARRRKVPITFSN